MIIRLYKSKVIDKDYKIYNFAIKDLYIIFYLIIFLLFILYLRWGFSLELIPIYNRWIIFFKETDYLFTLLLLELIIIVFLVSIKLKKNTRKRYLFKYPYSTKCTKTKYQYFNNLIAEKIFLFCTIYREIKRFLVISFFM